MEINNLINVDISELSYQTAGLEFTIYNEKENNEIEDPRRSTPPQKLSTSRRKFSHVRSRSNEIPNVPNVPPLPHQRYASGDNLFHKESPKSFDDNLCSDSFSFTWNTKFQDLVKQEDSLEKFQALAKLGRDFIAVSENYGRIIISELHVPEKDKTIKSISDSGRAGGAKYLVQDIFFKFSLDQSNSTDEKTWIYGKHSRNGEKAMKSACNELKGASTLFHLGNVGLNVPLLALIHYRGYCLVAVTRL